MRLTLSVEGIKKEYCHGCKYLRQVFDDVECRLFIDVACNPIPLEWCGVEKGARRCKECLAAEKRSKKK